MEALKYQSQVDYKGFDLWEQLSDHNLVSNGKGPSRKQDVENRLDNIRKKYKGFNYELVQGDTEYTVPVGLEADLAFIDGDHRDWAIQRDYDRTQNSKVIVLDDVYEPLIPGLGANNLQVSKDCSVAIFESWDLVRATETRINLMIVAQDSLIDKLSLKHR